MDETTCWPLEPFTWAELGSLGLSQSMLRRAQRERVVRTVVRGVYVRADLPDSLELRARAVAKAVRPHHVVTDRTAAWLHGVEVHGYAEREGPVPVETCALRGHEPTGLAGVDGRTRDLRPDDVMVLDGLRVTTPLRTALDLGCCLRRREAHAAMCALARSTGLTAQDLTRSLGRYRRRRGVVQLRSIVGLVDRRFESPREAWTFLAIADAGIALPEPQVWIEVDGVPTYRLDLAYRRRRVCVEYDGEEAHAGQESYDAERRRWLRDHDWTIVVVRNGDFSGDRLDRWLGELRDALQPDYSTRR